MIFRIEHPPKNGPLNELHLRFAEHLSEAFPSLPPESDDKKFVISAYTPQGHYVGGINGSCYWNGLEIDTLWVDKSHRGASIGCKLLAQAEEFAVQHGAVIAFLKTIDAKEFYEKLGYTVYGALEDRPIGSVLYYLKKRLDTALEGAE